MRRRHQWPKPVNDTFGHPAGDALVMAVSQRLTEAIRHHDTVARIGGDEFLILCPGADERGLGLIADRVLAALRRPVHTDSAELTVTASIGAVTAGPGRAPHELGRAADSAMYCAKQDGRDRLAL